MEYTCLKLVIYKTYIVSNIYLHKIQLSVQLEHSYDMLTYCT